MKKLQLSNTNTLVTSDFCKMIAPHTEIVVIAPWNGKPMPVTIVMLDSVSLTSCGDFSTINIAAKETDEKLDIETLVKLKNIHENILRLALVHPTFDELHDYIAGKDFVLQRQEQIKKIKSKIEQLTSMEDRSSYMNRLELLELSIAFLLPEDFTSYIVAIELQKEATDIHKLNRDTLLKAGLLAEKYNVRPCTYIEGCFTEKQKTDIDIAALSLVYDYRELQKVDRSSMRWIRGKNNGSE